MPILSSTDTHPATNAMNDPETRLLVYRKRLAALQHSPALTAGNIEDAIQEATEIAASILRVERASVWRLRPDHASIECMNLFERSKGKHSSGAVIRAEDVPAYFAAIAEERCIAAHDAQLDPRTSEFRTNYLQPLGIGAMLDVPIWVHGIMVGVICHEHIGAPRSWTVVEELLASAVADFVARVMEMSDHLRLERELKAQRVEIEELMSLRTTDLARINSALEANLGSWPASGTADLRGDHDLRELLDASPVPLVLNRAEDGSIQYANRRALELFGISAGEIPGLMAQDFYVDPSDRVAFVDRLRATGRVDGFVAKMRMRSGRPFYALMSAQIITSGGQRLSMVGFSDVTAQKLAEITVRQSEENIRTLFETAPVPLILSRVEDRTVLLANRRAADLFEVPLQGVIGRQTMDFYFDPADRPRLMERLEKDGFYNNEEIRLRTAEGRMFWALMSARVLDYEGTRAILTGVLDVTHQKELESKLRDLADTDSLTGVANRRAFMDSAALEILRTERTGQPVSICYLDIDHFKRVNDRHGHATGDEVLKHVSAAIAEELRAIDLLARIGGEEFAVLLPSTDIEGAMALAERVRAHVGRVRLPDLELSVTVSLGVAQRMSEESLDQLLARADRALYRAKQSGRNRVERG